MFHLALGPVLQIYWHIVSTTFWLWCLVWYSFPVEMFIIHALPLCGAVVIYYHFNRR